LLLLSIAVGSEVETEAVALLAGSLVERLPCGFSLVVPAVAVLGLLLVLMLSCGVVIVYEMGADEWQVLEIVLALEEDDSEEVLHAIPCFDACWRNFRVSFTFTVGWPRKKSSRVRPSFLVLVEVELLS